MKQLIILFLATLSFGCKQSSEPKRNEIFVDPNIKQKVRKKILNPDFSAYPDYVIKYEDGNHIDVNMFKNRFECNACFLGKDTLLIKNTEEGDGIGIKIFIINGNYELRNNLDKIKETGYKFTANTLYLNKKHFKAGDSIYGNLKFDFDRTNNLSGTKSNHKGEIFFRTKIFPNVKSMGASYK
ncbi:hypothetical protein [Epilithonimonas sp.]|uniref:hypothetical protein n=1 Tax=Epilithonimonas sp. TaxID=2894511 RepID=UPI0035B48AA7